jgi:hypothetical protein
MGRATVRDRPGNLKLSHPDHHLLFIADCIQYFAFAQGVIGGRVIVLPKGVDYGRFRHDSLSEVPKSEEDFFDIKSETRSSVGRQQNSPGHRQIQSIAVLREFA